MTGAGRPLRFLAVALGGWIAVRVALLWPVAGSLPTAIRGMSLAATTPPRAQPAAAPPIRGPVVATPTIALIAGDDAIAPARFLPVDTDGASLLVLGAVASGSTGRAARAARAPSPLPPFAPLPARADTRWSGSAWAIWRGRGTGTVDGGGQLGGAQAGIRLAYALDADRRWSLAGRLAAPLRARGSEAAIGLEWHPAPLPIRLVAERRIAIDATRSGTAFGIVGGINPTPVAPGLTLEGYGQAGAIHRDRIEGYADGALRLAHPLADRLDLALGAWGGAQRDASRLDLGPSVGLVVPVERHRLRLTLDWRQRIAGHARPGSGLALSLGTDF